MTEDERARRRELVGTWNAIAIEAARKGHFASACAAIRVALNLDPQSADLHSNYGNMLRRYGRPEQAMTELEIARGLDHRHLGAISNAACLAMDGGEPQLAVDLFALCLKEVPDEFDWQYGHACALLQAGRWKEGFAAHECRLAHRNYAQSTIPLWDGSPLEGRTLMIHAEQGLGDTIMFHRFLAYMNIGPQPENYFLLVQPQLQRLLTQDWDHIRRAGEATEADLHIPLMSIPAVRGIDHVEGHRYLLPPVNRMALDGPPGLKHKIGLVWKAKANWKQQSPDEHWHGVQKSMPLELLLELTAIPGAALFGLQVPTTDIEDLGAGHLVRDLQGSIHDFADLASFVHQMDVLVTVDTAPAHLGGALGKPTIVCLHHAGSWQWQTGTQTAWYDSVRTVRQTEPGVWPIEKVIEEVRNVL